jgi:Protein of unknown function (DUF4446)
MTRVDAITLVVAVVALAVAVFAYLNALQVRRRLWKLRAGAQPSDTSEPRQAPAAKVDDVAGGLADLGRRVDDLQSLGNTWRQSLRHVAVVRYDAFGDVSGAQSWSLAILDDAGDGVVVTAINGRDAARTYAKNVRAGESDAAVSPEELEAIAFARTDGVAGS